MIVQEPITGVSVLILRDHIYICTNLDPYTTSWVFTRAYQGKRVNPPYRSSNKGNPSFASKQRCSLQFQPSFCSAGLTFVLCLFGCSLFGRLFDFKVFNKANFNGYGSQYNGCVRVRYNSLFISSPLFTKGRIETTTWNSHVLGGW